MKISPCMTCNRVKDPENCENKNCNLWRRWFIGRWDQLRSFARQQHDSPPVPIGVPLGGRHYAAPHETRRYLQKDPCEDCPCPKDLCQTPCRMRQIWEEAKKEAQL